MSTKGTKGLETSLPETSPQPWRDRCIKAKWVRGNAYYCILPQPTSPKCQWCIPACRYQHLNRNQTIMPVIMPLSCQCHGHARSLCSCCSCGCLLKLALLGLPLEVAPVATSCSISDTTGAMSGMPCHLCMQSLVGQALATLCVCCRRGAGPGVAATRHSSIESSGKCMLGRWGTGIAHLCSQLARDVHRDCAAATSCSLMCDCTWCHRRARHQLLCVMPSHLTHQSGIHQL